MPIQVPLVVALWEHTQYHGRKRLVVEDTGDLAAEGFNDTTSSIGVHPGPDYAAWKAAHGGKEPTVGFFQNLNFGGPCLILTAGGYPNIHTLYNFGDIISSVKFNVSPPGAHIIAPLPLIVEIYKNANFTGGHITIVENSVNIPQDFGSDFNDVITSVRVKQGPNFVPGAKARLFSGLDFRNGEIDLPPGDYPNIGTSHGFNDVVSSIQVR